MASSSSADSELFEELKSVWSASARILEDLWLNLRDEEGEEGIPNPIQSFCGRLLLGSEVCNGRRQTEKRDEEAMAEREAGEEEEDGRTFLAIRGATQRILTRPIRIPTWITHVGRRSPTVGSRPHRWSGKGGPRKPHSWRWNILARIANQTVVDYVSTVGSRAFWPVRFTFRRGLPTSDGARSPRGIAPRGPYSWREHSGRKPDDGGFFGAG